MDNMQQLSVDMYMRDLYTLKKSNLLIEKINTFSFNTHKIFNLILWEFQHQETPSHHVQMPVHKMVELVGKKEVYRTKLFYQKIAKNLVQKTLDLIEPQEDAVDVTNLISRFTLEKGIIDVRVTDEFLELAGIHKIAAKERENQKHAKMTMQAENSTGKTKNFAKDFQAAGTDKKGIAKYGYTKINLSLVNSLKSKHSMTLYEYLLMKLHFHTFKKHQRDFLEITFDLNMLRKMLCHHHKSYEDFDLFHRKILKIAVDEINEKTDLIVEIQLQKSLNKVHAILFSLRKKKDFVLQIEGSSGIVVPFAPHQDQNTFVPATKPKEWSRDAKKPQPQNFGFDKNQAASVQNFSKHHAKPSHFSKPSSLDAIPGINDDVKKMILEIKNDPQQQALKEEAKLKLQKTRARHQPRMQEIAEAQKSGTRYTGENDLEDYFQPASGVMGNFLDNLLGQMQANMQAALEKADRFDGAERDIHFNNNLNNDLNVHHVKAASFSEASNASEVSAASMDFTSDIRSSDVSNISSIPNISNSNSKTPYTFRPPQGQQSENNIGDFLETHIDSPTKSNKSTKTSKASNTSKDKDLVKQNAVVPQKYQAPPTQLPAVQDFQYSQHLQYPHPDVLDAPNKKTAAKKKVNTKKKAKVELDVEVSQPSSKNTKGTKGAKGAKTDLKSKPNANAKPSPKSNSKIQTQSANTANTAKTPATSMAPYVPEDVARELRRLTPEQLEFYHLIEGVKKMRDEGHPTGLPADFLTRPLIELAAFKTGAKTLKEMILAKVWSEKKACLQKMLDPHSIYNKKPRSYIHANYEHKKIHGQTTTSPEFYDRDRMPYYAIGPVATRLDQTVIEIAVDDIVTEVLTSFAKFHQTFGFSALGKAYDTSNFDRIAGIARDSYGVHFYELDYEAFPDPKKRFLITYNIIKDQYLDKARHECKLLFTKIFNDQSVPELNDPIRNHAAPSFADAYENLFSTFSRFHTMEGFLRNKLRLTECRLFRERLCDYYQHAIKQEWHVLHHIHNRFAEELAKSRVVHNALDYLNGMGIYFETSEGYEMIQDHQFYTDNFDDKNIYITFDSAQKQRFFDEKLKGTLEAAVRSLGINVKPRMGY